SWRLKPPSIGDYLKLSIDARTARARADQVMRQRGVDPNAHYRAVVFVNNADPYANEYLRERIGIAGVNAIYSGQVPAALWRVRYFRASHPKESGGLERARGREGGKGTRLAECCKEKHVRKII